ncbi:hypothetical protein MRB53_041441 [Persea americana]|nr:hypothetical protein MRB53_041441 [Persea americana]
MGPISLQCLHQLHNHRVLRRPPGTTALHETNFVLRWSAYKMFVYGSTPKMLSMAIEQRGTIFSYILTAASPDVETNATLVQLDRIMSSPITMTAMAEFVACGTGSDGEQKSWSNKGRRGELQKGDPEKSLASSSRPHPSTSSSNSCTRPAQLHLLPCLNQSTIPSSPKTSLALSADNASPRTKEIFASFFTTCTLSSARQRSPQMSVDGSCPLDQSHRSGFICRQERVTSRVRRPWCRVASLRDRQPRRIRHGDTPTPPLSSDLFWSPNAPSASSAHPSSTAPPQERRSPTCTVSSSTWSPRSPSQTPSSICGSFDERQVRLPRSREPEAQQPARQIQDGREWRVQAHLLEADCLFAAHRGTGLRASPAARQAPHAPRSHSHDGKLIPGHMRLRSD